MKPHSTPGARWLAGALALIMAFAFAAPPAVAAEGATEAQAPPSDNPPAETPTLLAMADAKIRQARDMVQILMEKEIIPPIPAGVT